jgi:hypothetical protein
VKRDKSREQVTLKTPGERSELEGFPRQTLRQGKILWRVTRAGRNPWWFSSELSGRFDLHPPHGTCYLATDEMTAMLESVGPELVGGTVSGGFFEGRRLRRLALPRSYRARDLTDRSAVGFGLTAEIYTIVPYTLPQAWAKALHDAGAEGVLYHARHDPSLEGKAVGLFGKSGVRRSWSRGREVPIDGKLRSRLYESCRIRVLPIPRAAELRIIDA